MNISGILPIKNGENWINKNLPSIIANLESSDELIVIDDGSTDNTISLLHEFVKSDNRIRILSASGIGLVSALNEGISQSSFSWIARFDIDDSYPERRLNEQRSRIKSDVAAVFTDYLFRFNGKYRMGYIPSPVNHLATSLSLFRSQRTAHPSALINKKICLDAGGYQPSEYPAEDLGLWIRMSQKGQLVTVPSLGLEYNLRRGSVSHMNRTTIEQKRTRVLSSLEASLNIDEIFENLDSIIEEYSQVPLTQARILLHLWDFMHPIPRRLLGGKKEQEIRRRISKLLLHPSYLKTFAALGLNRQIRRVCR